MELYHRLWFAREDLARVYASYEYLVTSIADVSQTNKIPNFANIYEVISSYSHIFFNSLDFVVSG